MSIISGGAIFESSGTSLTFGGGSAYQNVPYSAPVVASGGVPPYTFSVVVGSLPIGLSLNSSTGVISGTPTAPGSSSFTLHATDSNSNILSLSTGITVFTLSSVAVSSATTSIKISTTLQLAALGTFSDTNAVDISSISTWACTAGSGCTGSTISSTGLFTAGTTPGSATAQATFSSISGTEVLTLSSTAPIILFPTSTLPNGQVFMAYSEGIPNNTTGQGVQITATGGVSPYTCSLLSGSLPTGLSLSNVAGNTNCLISGVPTSSGAGSSITIKVQDSASNSSTVVISGGISIISLASLTVNLAQSSIAANSSTNVSALGVYSDSSTANLPNAVSGGATFVQKQSAFTSSTVTSLALSAMSTTTGNLLVVFQTTGQGGSSCPSYSIPTDTAGNTYAAATTQLGGPVTPPPYYNCGQLFYAYNITGNASNITTCHTGSTTGLGCVVVEYTGIGSSDPRDQHPAPTQTTSVSACTPNAVTTGQANELGVIVCLPNSATGYTLPNGYTSRDSLSLSWDFADQTYTSTQTSIVPTTSFSGGITNEVSFIVTFKSNSPTAGGVVWSSATPTCATVSSQGLVTAQPVQTQCTSVITGTVGAVSNTATVTVTVTNPDTGIVISPSSAVKNLSQNQQFQALGNVTGNSYSASWGSSNSSIAGINASSGLATCSNSNAGTVSINATVSGFSSQSASLTCQTSSGTTLNAATCNLSDVQAQLPNISAASGTVTLNIPSGTCTWTGQLSYTVPAAVTSLTIHGNTVVTCNDSAAGTSAYACSSTDNTILVDSYAASNQLFNFIANAGSALRITGITFKGGSIGSAGKFDGFIAINGSTQGLRIDHSVFDTRTYSPVGTGGMAASRSSTPVYGVVDHNILFLVNSGNGFRNFSGGGTTAGHASWAQPTQFGSANFMFMEKNVMNGGFINDCDNGSRMVIRYNTLIAVPNFSDSGGWQGHQLGQGTDGKRGCRAIEAYKNYMTNPTPGSPIQSAGGGAGVGLSWGNILAAGYRFSIDLYNTRELAANNCGHTGGPVGGCAAPPSGTGYCGNGSSGVTSAWDGNNIAATGYPCIDQTGRGQGDLITGDLPNWLNSTTVPPSIAWPHQMLEPWYSWNETIASGNVVLNQTYNGVQMQANRDFYTQVSASPNTSTTVPFDGVHGGTGFGPGGFRPVHCTAGPGGSFGISPTGSYGVGYFATDANNNNGVLYVCTATDTWTPVYSPYQYPHPLDI